MSSEKYKLKQQWHTAMHLLKWLKSRTVITPTADKTVDQQEYYVFADMVKNGAVALEVILTISYKTKHTLTVSFSSDTLWCLSKEVENMSP